MFRFNDPGWLWALVLVPLLAGLFVYVSGRRRRALERFAESPLVARLTDSIDVVARRWKALLQLLAVALLAVAMARPQFGGRVETVRSRGQDIVVAVDLSRSMLAEDVAPSRLERARLAILRLIERLDGDRIGLVAFAGDAFVQSPLTVDYRAAAMFLSAMHPDMMPVQGTDLGVALTTALDALEQGARDTRVLVVVTDAEDHEGVYEDVLGRLEGVELYLVVIGTADGGPIPLYDDRGDRAGFLRDEEGNVVTTRVGEDALRDLADRGGATVVRAGRDVAAFDDLMTRIASGEGEEIDARQVTRFEEQYQLFLGLALLMLLAESLISDRRRIEREWVGRFE